MGALCNLCRVDVGCFCNLDANLLCQNCSPNTQSIKKAVITEQNVYNNSLKNKNKKRKLGYI